VLLQGSPPSFRGTGNPVSSILLDWPLWHNSTGETNVTGRFAHREGDLTHCQTCQRDLAEPDALKSASSHGTSEILHATSRDSLDHEAHLLRVFKGFLLTGVSTSIATSRQLIG
jgi:hypothetical protein